MWALNITHFIIFLVLKTHNSYFLRRQGSDRIIKQIIFPDFDFCTSTLEKQKTSKQNNRPPFSGREGWLSRKSASRSCRGPTFHSQHTKGLHCLQVQLQRIQDPFLSSVAFHTHAQTHAHIINW